MNRTTSKLKKKSSPAPTTKLDSKKKSIPGTRNPLKDLNTTARYNSTTCSSNTTTSSSSSVSIEPPKGCLRFFLPTTSSKNPPKSFNKTPKSAPISKPRSKPPISHKSQTTPFLNKAENDKDSIFRRFEQTPLPKCSPVLKEFGSESSQINRQWSFARRSGDGEDGGGNDHTPVVHKIQCRSNLDVIGKDDMEEDSSTITPPVLASISPEIQCDSSFPSTKSACYGAGHVLSGVTDKRKCRPRGFLAVEEEKDLGNGFQGVLNYSRLSLIPAPIEASVRWLSPPCKDGNEKENPQNVSTPFPSPSSSSSYAHGFSSDICGNSSSTNDTSSSSRRSTCFVTPAAHLNLEGAFGSEAVMSSEEWGYRYELPSTKISPSSGGDSLGSFNVVCTPESDTSLNDCVVGLSWFRKENGCMFEFDSMSNAHSTPSLSPKDRKSMCDPADILPLPGFSFQFTHLTNQQSDSIDETQLEKTFNDWRLGISSASYENSSHSQTRISWRDGLVSRMFEMEDLDCCRLLSDEEDDISCKVGVEVVQGPIFTDIVPPNELLSKQPEDYMQRNVKVQDPVFTGIVTQDEVLSEQPETYKQGNVKALGNSSSCAESISTEGAELIASSDSDWSLCYRNQLFVE